MRKALVAFGMVIALTLGITVAPTVVAVTTDGAVQVEQAAEAHSLTAPRDCKTYTFWSGSWRVYFVGQWVDNGWRRMAHDHVWHGSGPRQPSHRTVITCWRV